MTSSIPSAQLEAITRLELASIALDKARRALEHPDLHMGGGAILAPSGHKHLQETRATLSSITQLVRGSDPTAYQRAAPDQDAIAQHAVQATTALARAHDAVQDALDADSETLADPAQYRSLKDSLADLEQTARRARLGLISLTVRRTGMQPA